MVSNWTHLVRFIAEEDGQTHLGQVDSKQYPDVGLSILNGEKVQVKVVEGGPFDGKVSGRTMHIARVCHLLAEYTPSGLTNPSFSPLSAWTMSPLSAAWV